MNKILLVEDDLALSRGVALALKDNNEFVQAGTIEQAKMALANNDFDLAILDVTLPDGSGLDLLAEIKGSKPNLSVIMLTANDMETDIVAGLSLGADDYITKPFSLMVLRARVEVQLRKDNQSTMVFRMDDFIFDFQLMDFRKNGTSIELSKTEQKLLRLLVENKGITLTRSHLVDRVWTDGAEYVDENALSVTIKRLRNKLENDASSPKYIKTVYGIGYTWAVK